MIHVDCAQRRTKRSKQLPQVLSRAGQPQATHVRGSESLFRRRPAFPRSRQCLWLHAWIVSSPLSSFPARVRSAVLCIDTAGTALTAQEVGRARLDHRTPQTESFRLRDQRSAEGTERSPQSNGGSGSPQGGRICSATSAVGFGTSRSSQAHC